MSMPTSSRAPGGTGAGNAARVEVRQYSRGTILAVWAVAALPMGVLAWVVVPALAGGGATDRHFTTTLIAALTAGLIWQFVLVLGLVAQEQRSLRWAVLREALWLRSPTTAGGRRGGRLWLWILPFVLGYGALQLIPVGVPAPAGRDLGTFLESADGQAYLQGNGGLLALIIVMFLFNTVLGEELLFRGLLLPRMRTAFGKADWVANGALFSLYHLHVPWTIPISLVTDMFLFAYPTKRFRSAWMGVAIHSAQSVFLIAIITGLVLS